MSSHLPCPFCGSKNLQDRFTIYGEAVMCLDCRSQGPDKPTNAEAWEHWNRRTLGRAEPAPTSEVTEP
jgi:Lar family restriction alleviation protein